MRPLFLGFILVLAGCAAGAPHTQFDGGPDAQSVWPDAGRDAGSVTHDAGSDGGSASDAGTDGGSGEPDAGHDAGSIVTPDAGSPMDAGTDAGTPVLDAGACGMASTGDTLVFDGVDDAAKYPTSQAMTPGATIESWDAFDLTWDADYLYVTMVSKAFEDEIKPVHIYVEAATTLGSATVGTGKTYSGRTPTLPFAPTHLIAARRTSDTGTGGPYDGVYTPASSWNDRATPLVEGTDVFVSSDMHTISIRVPWTALGCPTQLRLSAHVVNAVDGNEWKDLVPVAATPWTSSGGAFYEIDLTGDPAISGWTLR